MVFILDLAAMNFRLDCFEEALEWVETFNKRIKFEVALAQTRPDLLAQVESIRTQSLEAIY